MAIKASNQISFSEQKKVIKITEWYIASVENDVDKIQTNKDDMESLGWQTKVPKTDAEHPFLWNCEEVEYSSGDIDISTPLLIASSNNVKNITNYYAITEKPIAPDVNSDEWTSDFSVVGTNLSSKNKYLWNYEIIEYADGTTSDPQPAIIGVYGDSGEDAITLKIYATEGFQFKEGVDESERLDKIILKTAAYKGAEPITEATFRWEYWKNNTTEGTESDGTNTANELENTWVQIEDATGEFLEVNISDSHAFSTIRCVMTYIDEEGKEFIFEDYVTLTKQVDVYTASMRFFTGSNVFMQGQEHIAGYIELSKNNELVEGSATGVCYTGESVIVDGIITPSEGYTKQEDDPDLMYFIHHTDDICQITLGKYVDGQWVVQEQDETKYIYSSDSINDIKSNIFVVAKKDITRSEEIGVKVYLNTMIETDYIIDNTVTEQTTGNYWVVENEGYVQKILPNEYTSDTTYYVSVEKIKPDENTLVASTRTTIIDLNDTLVSNTPPSNPYNGQIWFDTTEGVFKVFNGDEWVKDTSTPPGTNVYTTRPTSYQKDDLWIVEDSWIDVQYVLANNITDTTSGTYWVEDDSGKYVEKTLPNEYNADKTYYTREENKITQVNSYITTEATESNYKDYFVFKEEKYITPNDYDADVVYYREFVYYPGAVLKAITSSDVFNETHWIDTHPDLTNMQDNIEQYFKFNPSTGLRIGKINLQSYVNLDADSLDFYAGEDENPKVTIGTDKTEIKNLTVKDSADFDCPISVDRKVSVVNTYDDSKTYCPGFSWKLESDGAFSLVLGVE